MPIRKAAFSTDVLDYMAGLARQDELLARVEREASERPDSEMQITPDQGALLTLLARLVGAQRALEVGTFQGYGAICIARGLAPGGTLTILELSEEFASAAERNLAAAGLTDRVRVQVGPGVDSLEVMPEEPTFDFVFLDADKGGYPRYYDLLVPRLVTGGLLLIDNTLLRGEVVAPDDDRSRIVAELNERIADDDRVDSALALVADGLTFVRKR
jgi:caffeoyl-CoA O-methyltransferase